ncbi:unnamed protein product, partial [Discosporangium mesarthrocarpum]
MGLSGSRPLIPLKDAHAMLNDAELRNKLEKAFERISDRGERRMGESYPIDVKTFHMYFLEAFPIVPQVVAETLFDAFDTSRRGALSQDELMCGAAIMIKGDASEKIRLLFQIYDIRRTGYVDCDTLRKLLNLIYTMERKAIDVALNWLFRASRRQGELDVEEFHARLKPVVTSRGSAAAAAAEPLLAWFRALCSRVLMEPDREVVELEQVYNPERDLHKVQQKFKLTKGVMESLQHRYAMLCKRGSSGTLDAQVGV